MKQAVLVIDLQNDYARGGKLPLEGIEAAVQKTADVIADARHKGIPVIHVQHIFANNEKPFFAPDTPGAAFQEAVKPLAHEPVVVKNSVNAFLNTDLQRILDELEITALTITGAMSHMCIDAATRAAADRGYAVTVLHDACATLDLEFDGVQVPAAHVHAAMMAALAFAYARVMSTEDYLRAQR